MATVVAATELPSLLLVLGFVSSLLSLLIGFFFAFVRCSLVLSRVFSAAGPNFHLILYFFYLFFTGRERARREWINISFCFLQPLAVISVTRSDVGCHLAADCSAVRNRSVVTSRSLMAAANQSAAHFHTRALPSACSQAPSCAADLSPD